MPDLSAKPVDWVRTTLGKVASYINGYAFTPTDWSQSGLPIIRIAQMSDPETPLDHYQGRLSERYRVENGDLLFSWSATLMTLIWDRGPAFVNQHIFKVLPRDGVSRAFLHHLLDSTMEHLAAQSHGTTMRHIKRSDLLPFEVALPPSSEQRLIAQILDTVDEAIRKTEQLIAKVKVVKQGLLHDLLTRGIDDNGELRDPERHPEQFKHSPLGRIPLNWKVGRLEEWLVDSPRNGYSAKPVEQWTGHLILGLGCLTTDGFRPLQLKNVVPGNPSLARAKLHNGDLLISRSNTRELVGLAGIYRDVGCTCYYPDLMMRLQPRKAALSTKFLARLLRHSSMRGQLQRLASGTSGSMVKITGAMVRRMSMIIPSLREQQRIEKVAAELETELALSQTRVTKLRLLKSGLMDDLLAGRVRVTPLLENSTG